MYSAYVYCDVYRNFDKIITSQAVSCYLFILIWYSYGYIPKFMNYILMEEVPLVPNEEPSLARNIEFTFLIFSFNYNKV